MALSFSFGYYAMYKSSKPLLITFDLINKYLQDFKYISNNDENFVDLVTFPQRLFYLQTIVDLWTTWRVGVPPLHAVENPSSTSTDSTTAGLCSVVAHIYQKKKKRPVFTENNMHINRPL